MAKHIKFTIHGRLSGLNEYTNACRRNAYLANNMKRDNEETVKLAILSDKLKKIDKYPIILKITWYEPNKRRDIDNITFATKFIQDSLVNNGILENDSQKCVCGLSHIVRIDKDNPRIEVEIEVAK